MVPIPPGSLTMGVPPGEEDRENVPEKFRGWSAPQHRVSIEQRFALGKYTVTRAEFSAFVGETGYQTGDTCRIFAENKDKHYWGFEERSGYTWRHPGFPQTDRDPVVCVSWDDAQTYAAWLSKKTNRSYRLPNEAEWEYAARAGSPYARIWGDGRAQACRFANVADQTLFSILNDQSDPGRYFNCTDGFPFTAPVGSFEPNAFALHDMLGNVWQWTGDCWNRNYVGAPADGTAWVTGDCRRRVSRGASWVTNQWIGRVGSRFGVVAGFRTTEGGFRVARTL